MTRTAKPILKMCAAALLWTGAAQAQTPKPAAETAPPASAAPVPAGAYVLDKSHASLIVRLDHLGFSLYTARFAKFDAKLQFDPAAPAAARVSVDIDPMSLESDNPPPGFLDTLKGAQWLDAGKFPQISFRTTKVEVTGAKTARITGDFTLRGVTKPVILDATYNGGYAGHPMDPHARIGFSAKGAFKRSDFGMGFGIPAPGTTMGVGDKVDVTVEAEFTGPPLAKTGG